MKRFERTAFLIVAGLLLWFLALFPLLSIDAITRLIASKGQLEPGNFALILFLEISRAVTTIVALIAGIMLVTRFPERADGRALTFLVIFLALTFEKILSGVVYSGPMQQRLTVGLLNAGISRSMLAWLFGPTIWSIWPALAAIMRFSVVFPRPILSDTIDASAADDRRGMLRDAGIAGLDIGSVFRGLSKRLLAAGLFEALPLSAIALVMVVVTSVVGGRMAALIFALGTMLVGALVITNLRASYRVVEPEEKARIRWIWRGFIAAAALFLIAAVPLLVLNDPVTSTSALILLTLAPAAMMLCMAVAVTTRSR